MDNAARPATWAPRIQAKLQIGRTDDPSEREADEVAAELVAEEPRSAAATLSSEQPGVRRKCADCAVQEMDDIVVRWRTNHTGAVATDDLAEQLRKIRGVGSHPLHADLRSSMESRLRVDLSRVRIHQNPQAADLADRIHARAFTVGRDIFFNRGEYRPESRDGKLLLAHELTHVVQQGAASSVTPLVQRTCTACSEDTEEVVQRNPKDGGDSCARNPDEQEELTRALRFKGLLQRWLSTRVDTKDLTVGRLPKLRARRARRLCLLDRCGALDTPLTGEQRDRLMAFDAATDEGRAVGACSTASSAPAPEPPPPPEQEEEKACPNFSPGPATKGKSLWVLGNYKKPTQWATERAEAQAALQPDGWAPSLDDFRAAAGGRADLVASTAKEVVDFVKKQGPEGIAELNLVGHGNELALSLSGTITPPTAGDSLKVEFSPEGDVSHTVFDPVTNGESMERYFAPGASVKLYACNTGLSRVLPQEMAKTICRLVFAPNNTISYCPDINRSGTKIESRKFVFVEGFDQGREKTCEVDRRTPFSELLPFMKAWEPNTKKQQKPLELDGGIDDL